MQTTTEPTLTVTKIATDTYTVPSASQPGTFWIVKLVDSNLTCDCPAGFYRGRCRHGAQVEAHLAAEQRAAYVATVDASKLAILRTLGIMAPRQTA